MMRWTWRTGRSQELGRALLEVGDYNVIAVDWGGGSLPLYRYLGFLLLFSHFSLICLQL